MFIRTKNLICVCFTALASSVSAADLTVDMKCPNFVKAGTTLNATVVVYNDDCDYSYNIIRGMTMLMGNSNGTLGGFGLWGPFAKPFSGWTVPKATCDQYGDVITPGQSAPKSVLIMTVPSGTVLTGKLASAIFGIITTQGQGLGTGSCFVNVAP
jgi:hypothetical protein